MTTPTPDDQVALIVQAAARAERARIADAADEVAERFMERCRSRPQGSGEGFYDIFDAFSSFAETLRAQPTQEGSP
jgi:hypothetical protein